MVATIILLFLLSFVLSQTTSLDVPHFTDIFPQSIDPNDPKSTITVPLNDTDTFFRIDYTHLVAPLDLTGKYFGCSFRVPRLVAGRVVFDIYSDFNLTNDIWSGATCAPLCRDGLHSEITEHDFTSMGGILNWYLLVNVTAESQKPPLDLEFSCSVRWKTVSIVGFAIGCTGGVLLVVIVCGVWLCPLLFKWTKNSSAREGRDSLEEEYPLGTFHSEDNNSDIKIPKKSRSFSRNSSVNFEEEEKGKKYFSDHESRSRNRLMEDDNF